MDEQSTTRFVTELVSTNASTKKRRGKNSKDKRGAQNDEMTVTKSYAGNELGICLRYICTTCIVSFEYALK